MRPLIELRAAEKAYGKQVILDRTTLTVREGEHIALIGRNGSGKTTLMRIFAGDEDLEAGTLTLTPHARLGVLRQHEILPDTGTALSYLEHSGKPAWEILKLCGKFDLTPSDLNRVPLSLSGGYQMRIKLLRVLLNDPNVLLLDEPVNYLDLPTLLLLERFLVNFAGAFVMTSHDREMLHRTCTTTWEIGQGRLTEYAGPVEDYLDFKEEQLRFTEATNKKVKREMAKQQAFVDRFRYKASKASQAQSKMKHIARLRHQLTAVGSDLPTVKVKIPCPPYVAGTALRCDQLTVGYGQTPIAKNINLEFVRGAKVTILGENGQGKSTLLKTLAGVLPPLEGQAKWWHRADLGYYAQHTHESLIPSQTVLQTLTLAAPPAAPGERILMMAGTLLFRGDDLEKTCSVLSGGERARLALGCLLLQEHNVLLLDEPTNHLDAETVETLAEALQEYKGTVVFISHARTFVNAVADRLYEVRGGAVRFLTGTYEEYVEDLLSVFAEHEKVEAPQSATKTLNDAERLARKERQRQAQKLQSTLASLEKDRSAILAYFFENPTDYAPDKATRLQDLNVEINRLEDQWLRLTTE
jgi:ATP-binding cassette subfamily F protein 3